MRATWNTGGILLVLCGVFALVAPGALGPGLGVGVAVAGAVLYATAVLVFAIGFSRAASVVLRRPLGLTAMVVVAVWPLIARPVGDALNAGGPVPSVAARAFWAVDVVVSLGAALVAAVRIGRTGVIPRPWAWAPLWALGVLVVCAVVPQLVAVGAPSAGVELVPLFSVLGVIGSLAGTLGLGILALVLAAQLRPGSVEILRTR